MRAYVIAQSGFEKIKATLCEAPAPRRAARR
jgi:hypothetical protein